MFFSLSLYILKQSNQNQNDQKQQCCFMEDKITLHSFQGNCSFNSCNPLKQPGGKLKNITLQLHINTRKCSLSLNLTSSEICCIPRPCDALHPQGQGGSPKTHHQYYVPKHVGTADWKMAGERSHQPDTRMYFEPNDCIGNKNDTD